MASMQICKPACQGNYKETEKVKYSSSSLGYCSTEHTHHEHNSSGCSITKDGHHMGGLTHKHPSHSTTGHHHGLTEKISGYFTHNSSHQGHHDHKHGHHSSNHHANYGYTEKMEERTSCNSGNMKCTMHIKKKSTWKGNRKDGSNGSDSESPNQGCKKKC